jgi:hypothetical protein
MLNVLAPIVVKLLVMESLITSMAVRIPTSALMPSAIIMMVRNVLSDCDLIDSKAILIFSRSKVFMGRR